MSTKRKADTAGAGDAGVDWRSFARRPFKRGFIPYQVRTSAAQAAKRRTTAGIEILEDPAGSGATPAPLEAFEELGVLPPWAKEALSGLECVEPTPMQAQALPICIAGQNFIGVAPPGSGQDMAFLLPAIVHIEDQPPLADLDPGPVALALVPTRELAAQTAKLASKLLANSNRSGSHTGGVRVVCLHEGSTRKEQVKQLGTSGSHIVVGTPVRVHDLASKDHLPLLRVTFLVLHELDKLLELGLATEVQVREISSWIRPERQVAIFSSTWPKAANDLAGELCNPSGLPVRISTDVGEWEEAVDEAAAPAATDAGAEEFPDGW